MGVSAAQSREDEKAEKKKWWESKDLFRFSLAMTIIIGFLIILGIAIVGQFTDIPTLAGIFSGWIVAIIAFYFMEQASDRTAQIISDETGKQLDKLQDHGEETLDKVGTELASQVEFWKNKAMGFRNLLIETDPSLKSEEDEGPSE